ncbi:hypothetical protein M409DRAFT_49111 [Zasmidium cellare ATCC 36951]|uniref:Methyltransferase domain-containing protein n=1 Tax=Zasmidium cellare ATCC 36951 TaxID=1080233 RepID=A0A6A6D7N6_ZASCE|nr:uncharacterized protein M409DRAFT_49111 [Zasmidium cellare ATCC 36951]KAF2174252.1 hypothetical protein M409DRAFT_49111 [Zasmidium cellare ATCC 36951]
MLGDPIIKAPMQNPKRILEVGCGTGNVARRLAGIYPRTTVIGVDLSPVPASQAPPPNILFIQGDIHDLADDSAKAPELRRGSFDYIFSRMLVFGIKDWPQHIAQLKRLLTPGGWLELQEVDLTGLFDGQQNSISGDWTWLSEQRAAFAKLGLHIGCAPVLENHLQDAGFQNVHTQMYRWMLGPWEGHPETDLMAQFSTKYTADANFTAYKKVLGNHKSDSELSAVREEMRQAFSWSEDGKHMRFFVAYGQKAIQ